MSRRNSSVKGRLPDTKQMVKEILIENWRKGVTLQGIYKHIRTEYVEEITSRRKNLVKTYLRDLMEQEIIVNITGKGLVGHLKLRNKKQFVKNVMSGKRRNKVQTVNSTESSIETSDRHINDAQTSQMFSQRQEQQQQQQELIIRHIPSTQLENANTEMGVNIQRLASHLNLKNKKQFVKSVMSRKRRNKVKAVSSTESSTETSDGHINDGQTSQMLSQHQEQKQQQQILAISHIPSSPLENTNAEMGVNIQRLVGNLNLKNKKQLVKSVMSRKRWNKVRAVSSTECSTEPSDRDIHNDHINEILSQHQEQQQQKELVFPLTSSTPLDTTNAEMCMNMQVLDAPVQQKRTVKRKKGYSFETPRSSWQRKKSKSLEVITEAIY